MKTTPFNSGLIWGGLLIMLYLVFYLLGPESFAGAGLKWISFAITVFALVYFPNQKRKENGGYLSFGQTYGFSVLMILISTVVLFAFSWILFGLVDTEFMLGMKDMIMEREMQNAIDRGTPESQLAWVEKSIEFSFSAWGQVVFTLVGIAMNCVIALITSVIIRKNKPEFA